MRRFDNACLTRVQPLGRDVAWASRSRQEGAGTESADEKAERSGLFPPKGDNIISRGET